MREKIALFCDLNSITPITGYQEFYEILSTSEYKNCIVYNTYDFLTQGIRDHYTHTIDDEHFFQIGDIGSEKLMKPIRLHLDAVQQILSNIQPSTIYVIDDAAKIAYIHILGSRDGVEKKLTEQGSAIFPI